MPLLASASEVEEPIAEAIEQKVITSDHNFNFKLNALIIFFGLGDLSLEYKLTPNITLGGSLIFGGFTQKSVNQIYEFDIRTFGGNIKANYYFHGAFKDSFYISSRFGTFDFDVKLKNSTIPVSSEFDSTYIGASLGYAWHWSNINFSVGAGYNHSFEDDEALIKVDNLSGTTTVRVNYNLILDAALGITF